MNFGVRSKCGFGAPWTACWSRRVPNCSRDVCSVWRYLPTLCLPSGSLEGRLSRSRSSSTLEGVTDSLRARSPPPSGAPDRRDAAVLRSEPASVRADAFPVPALRDHTRGRGSGAPVRACQAQGGRARGTGAGDPAPISWVHTGGVAWLGNDVGPASVAGLAAFLALDQRSRRGDVLACILLIAAILSFSVGVAFAIGAGAWILAERGGRRIWVAVLPLVLYGAWWLWALKFRGGS